MEDQGKNRTKTANGTDGSLYLSQVPDVFTLSIVSKNNENLKSLSSVVKCQERGGGYFLAIVITITILIIAVAVVGLLILIRYADIGIL